MRISNTISPPGEATATRSPTLAEQGLAYGAVVADAAGLGVRFGCADDGVGLMAGVAVLAHGDGPADGDLVGRLLALLDDDRVLDDVFQLADAAFEEALHGLGLVVAGILADVTFGLGFGDHHGDLMPPRVDKVGKLFLDFVQPLCGQIYRLVVAHHFDSFLLSDARRRPGIAPEHAAVRSGETNRCETNGRQDENVSCDSSLASRLGAVAARPAKKGHEKHRQAAAPDARYAPQSNSRPTPIVRSRRTGCGRCLLMLP